VCVSESEAPLPQTLQNAPIHVYASPAYFSLHHTGTLRNNQQHPATHSNTQQHTATHSNVLQLTCMHLQPNFCFVTATHCSTLQHTATHSNTLHDAATHLHVSPAHFPYACASSPCTATHFNTMQHTATCIPALLRLVLHVCLTHACCHSFG